MWLGAMHLLLLVMPMVALWLAYGGRKSA